MDPDLKRRLLQRCQQLGLHPYEDTPRQPEGGHSDRRETTAREESPASPRKAAKRVPRRVLPSLVTLQAAARTRSEDFEQHLHVSRSRSEAATEELVDWLCKSVLSLKLYAAMASINWMFVEGLLLHSRIAVSVFQQDAPFKLYYLIGWGLPAVCVLAWSLVMESRMKTHCWRGYGHSPFVWIISGPMMMALLINTVFLINIIRILLTKLQSNTSIETMQLRKVSKATALLFPLLGITHLFFCINPRDDAHFESAYVICNALLQSSQ
ncbi:hypothetical protein HPB47_003105, partial [Ixodes persulcatus]